MRELLIFFATILGMEGFAYAAHRWLMHGPGWFLHASHHRVRAGLFELNDLYAVIFAMPSIVLIDLGVSQGWGGAATATGAGIAAYGAIYFLFHDWVVHRRLPHRIVPRSAYFKRIVQAHRLHHVVESKRGTVSFGFLYAPPIADLKQHLQSTRSGRLREPGAAASTSQFAGPPPE
jgi:beta-carotene 3-hydroxylase